MPTEPRAARPHMPNYGLLPPGRRPRPPALELGRGAAPRQPKLLGVDRRGERRAARDAGLVRVGGGRALVQHRRREPQGAEPGARPALRRDDRGRRRGGDRRGRGGARVRAAGAGARRARLRGEVRDGLPARLARLRGAPARRVRVRRERRTVRGRRDALDASRERALALARRRSRRSASWRSSSPCRATSSSPVRATSRSGSASSCTAPPRASPRRSTGRSSRSARGRRGRRSRGS